MRNAAIFVWTILFIATTVEAFDNMDTHPKITEVAAKTNLNLKNYMINNLGFDNGLNTVMLKDSNISILEWLIKGSDEEDTLTSMCRASNHFNNPRLPWKDAFLTDQAWWQPTVCASWRPIYSTVTWATGFRAENTPETSFSTNPQYKPINWNVRDERKLS